MEAAIFKLLWNQCQEENQQVQYGLAIPRNEFYEYYINGLKNFLNEQKFQIFWVEEGEEDNEVSEGL